MSIELKPCANCNGVATLHSVDMCETVCVVCMNCGMRTPAFSDIRKVEAIWNRRAGENQLPVATN